MSIRLDTWSDLYVDGIVTLERGRFNLKTGALMSFIVPQTAESDSLFYSLGHYINTQFTMHLFSTNVAVNAAAVLASFTAAECTFAGYATVLMTSWSSIGIDGSGAAATVNSGQCLFTPTGIGGSGNVWGYFVTDVAGTRWFGAENFGVALTVPQGITLEIDLTYTYLSRF
jgi:hypothetical protein